jgi:GR25 family glycosyltransferase involved in LPS biosynthesis
MDWKTFIDINNIKVFCICLIDRNDKYKSVITEFKKINLIQHVNFHRPEKNDIPALGCFLSHKHCMMDAFNDKKHALVFEDDVVFTSDCSGKIGHVNEFLNHEMNADIKWDTIRLGCFLTSIHKDKHNTSHVQLSKSFMAHALIYNANLMQTLLNDDTFDGREQIDDYLHNNDGIKEYALVDPMCYQRILNYSDNIWMSTSVQNIIQQKYIYENIQYYNNKCVKLIQCLPIRIQEKINIWNILYMIF